MAEYDNRNRFTLFKNNRKREGKKDPDWTGTYTDANGKEHWLSGWITEIKSNGDKFLSGTVKIKEQQGDIPSAKVAPRELDDAIPF